jgi:predicted membrane-bound dolichyl-phosphate-mannose-protein mannosyltransferase
MTRRGSLVYYLASWICGGLFLTVAMYLQEKASPQGMGMGPTGAGAAIITTYFLVLVFCAFLSVVFAFFLRLIMRLLHAESLWQWVLAGTALSMPIVWVVRWASWWMDSSGVQGVGREIAVLLFLGVRGIAENHPLLGLPVAAMTAGILFLIHRAFGREYPAVEKK